MENADFNFTDFQEIIERLILRDDLPSIPEAIDKLFMGTANINRESMSEIQDEQIEAMAINLWAWEVSKRSQLALSEEQRARLHYVACKLLCMCDISLASEESIRQLIMLSIKAGKECVDVGNTLNADELFQAAMTALEQLYVNFMQISFSEVHLFREKIAIEKDRFRLLCYQAESAFAQGDFQRASTYALRCKDMLMMLPNMMSCLHILCCSFGEMAFKQKKYEESSFWLRQSYDVGNMDKNSVGPEMLAKVLRLLATVYLNWDARKYYDEALNAIMLANQEYVNPGGLFLKMRILLKGDTTNEELLKVVTEIAHFDTSVNFCLKTAKLLIDHERESVGLYFLSTICKHFKSPENIEKSLFFNIDMLLQRREEILSTKKIQEIITGQQIGSELTTKVVDWLQRIFWTRASNSFELKIFAEALHWYSYSLKFYGFHQTDLDLAKLQRNIASCCLNLKQVEKAKEAVAEAERMDPTNILTQFYILNIAILEGNCDRALQIITALETSLADEKANKNNLPESQASTSSLLYLAAKFAVQNGQEILARKSWECLVQHSKNQELALKALLCLIHRVLPRIQTSEFENIKQEVDTVLLYLNTAHMKLAEPFQGEHSASDSRDKEAHEFQKIAWNMALHCSKDPAMMRQFFMFSYKLSLFCPSEEAILITRKSCLLMAAAIDLQQSRKTEILSEKTNLLNRALQQTQECKKIWNVMKQTGDFSNDGCETLLVLYEFEVKTKLNDPLLDSFLEPVWELPHLDSETFEKMAVLAMERPAYHPSVAVTALKRALFLHKKEDPIDVLKYSKCVRNLINITVTCRTSSEEFSSLAEAWDHFEDALSVINHTEGYPEMEIAWLMSKSWNIGISVYNKSQYVSAERWCSLSLHFLNRLGSLKENYEAQINVLYSEFMEAINIKRARFSEKNDK